MLAVDVGRPFVAVAHHPTSDSPPPKGDESSLIISYAKSEDPQEALHLYHRLQQQDDIAPPSSPAFVALVKACGALKDCQNGCELHAEIARHGLHHTNPFVGSSLVDMYAKFGWLAKAQEVFDQLPVRDLVSWNALISGYAHHGQGDIALDCFAQMQLEDVSPSTITYVCALKACGSIRATRKGEQIHKELVDKGLLKKNVIVGNALIDMYIKFGFFEKAQDAFDQLSVRDIVSWNSLIAGYAHQGRGEEALKCFKSLQQDGISPDYVTFICSLKACGNTRASYIGQEIHKQIAHTGLLESNLAVGNALVDMYLKCGMLCQAREVFDRMPVRDLITWNSLIAGYVDHDYYEEALNCFEQMRHEGICPGSVTFAGKLKACAGIKAIKKCFEVHSEIFEQGLETDLLLGSTLLDTYAKCGWLAEAQEVFDNLSIRDVVSWTALIAGYVECGFCKEALDYFDQMLHEGIPPDGVTFVCGLKACGDLREAGRARDLHTMIKRNGLERDLCVGSFLVDMLAKCGFLKEADDVFHKLPSHSIIAWNALLGGYSDHGQADKALSYFDQMKAEGVSPDAATYVSKLKACGIAGALVNGREVHTEIMQQGLLDEDFLLGNALVDMYAKCGTVSEARDVFEKISVRDIVSWNALISGYAQQGEIENVVASLSRMSKEGIHPSLVTFVSTLNACNHTGLVDKGQHYFKVMKDEFGLNPILEHYTCMLDLFCRAGQLGNAWVLMMKTPIHPDHIIWHSLLGASQKWGNAEIGSLAFDQLMQLDKEDSVAYVGMSNIYADVM